MASRRRRREDPGDGTTPHVVLAEEDEADIIDEVGAELDKESGDLTADVEEVRKIGAVDAASVIANRRSQSALNRKRKGEDVRFNADDLISKYDWAVKAWTAGTFDDIAVRQLTGAGVTYKIKSRPRSGSELYDALMLVHGQCEATEYEVNVIDQTTKQYRVKNGRITLPDTRPAPQQGQPMPYPPPQYAPPQYQPQPAPPPVQQPAPQYPAQPSIDPMAMMNQMFQLMLQMQQAVQPAQPQYQPQPAPQPQVVLTPPPQTQDLAAQMAWMQGAMQLFQQMQAALQHPTHGAPQPQTQPQQPVQQAPQMMGPSRPAPEGMIWTWEPGFGFVLTPKIAAPQEPSRNPMYRGPRAPYYPQGDPSHPSQQQQQPPPPAPKSIADQWQESMGVLRTASRVVREAQSLFPGFGEPQVQEAPVVDEDDDSPIKIIDTGHGKLALNKEDGALRWAETGMMALPGVMKWISEQADKIQKASAERREPPPRRQLPPGYVEVDANYQPPPGYVAVPVDPPQEGDLPPPPANVPPPITAPGRSAWETSNR